jgi:hypothetical protein
MSKIKSASALYKRIQKKHRLTADVLRSRHPEAVGFFKSKGIDPEKIRLHAAKLITSGALAGSLMISSPKIDGLATIPTVIAENLPQTITQQKLVNLLKRILPSQVKPLTPEQEKNISETIFKNLGLKITPVLEGNRLNQCYGFIGAEQHLPRFQGDTENQHDEFQFKGVTPGKGGWGYFASSKGNLTSDLIDKEKYYVAVQTLYLPDWNTNTKYLSQWYKYRKVMVINPVNGKIIVADVADAGPAKWTGKHFGGSPEVMAYLGLNVGMQKGPVILFFVDDQENQIPLGPLEYTLDKITTVTQKN